GHPGECGDPSRVWIPLEYGQHARRPDNAHRGEDDQPVREQLTVRRSVPAVGLLSQQVVQPRMGTTAGRARSLQRAEWQFDSAPPGGVRVRRYEGARRYQLQQVVETDAVHRSAPGSRHCEYRFLITKDTKLLEGHEEERRGVERMKRLFALALVTSLGLPSI